MVYRVIQETQPLYSDHCLIAYCTVEPHNPPLLVAACATVAVTEAEVEAEGLGEEKEMCVGLIWCWGKFH